MSSQQTISAGKFSRHSRTVVRDPLQIPVALDFGAERFVPRPIEVLRSVALWMLTVAVAVGGALLVGNMPELNAAVPDPAPVAGEVREWYLPDVLFNEHAPVAEPIATF